MHLLSWYGKYERPLSSLSLIGGFVFDALTLTRVDHFWENMWVIGHLVIVGVCILLIHKVESHPGDEANPDKSHFWLVNIMQFFFGGLLSVFLVFYFRSGDISISWPFILLLGVAFWANERLKRQYVRMTFQFSLFFLSTFAVAIYLVPVFAHSIGAGTFVLSGLISLVVMVAFLRVIAFINEDKFYKNRRRILLAIFGIFAGINVLYFTNLIPPIPLSVKDSDVYHNLQKNAAGQYVVEVEPASWRDYFTLYKNFHELSGDAVYAYSAVFSPTDLNATIVHDWQYYDPTQKDWIDQGKVILTVVGGRSEGFRTFSVKSDLAPGNWRVNVETLRGQVIGRIRFNIVSSTTTPPLVKKVLQ